jgi:hypothetical protein
MVCRDRSNLMGVPVDQPAVDTISISQLRADALRATRAYFAVGLGPLVFVTLIDRIPERPEWLSLAAVAACPVVALWVAQSRRDYTAGMLRATVWVIGALGCLILLGIASIVGAVSVVIALGKTMPVLWYLALFLPIAVAVLVYLILPSWRSARRLLHVRLPPAGIPLTEIMEPLVRPAFPTKWSIGNSADERIGFTHQLVAIAVGIPAIVGLVWSLVHRREAPFLIMIMSVVPLVIAANLMGKASRLKAKVAAEALRPFGADFVANVPEGVLECQRSEHASNTIPCGAQSRKAIPEIGEAQACNAGSGQLARPKEQLPKSRPAIGPDSSTLIGPAQTISHRSVATSPGQESGEEYQPLHHRPCSVPKTTVWCCTSR